MSVSIREVIETGGYDLTKLDDARWLLAQETEFDQLIEQAENLVEEAEDAEEDE